MKRLFCLCVIVTMIPVAGGAQVPAAVLATTIVARQTSGWFYADGAMKEDSTAFELTFQVTDSSIIRRTVKNQRSGEVLTDDTEYFFVRDLLFSKQARASLPFRELSREMRKLVPPIRAIGRPGMDALEILQIGPDWIQSVKTVGDYMVVGRYVRSQ